MTVDRLTNIEVVLHEAVWCRSRRSFNLAAGTQDSRFGAHSKCGGRTSDHLLLTQYTLERCRSPVSVVFD